MKDEMTDNQLEAEIAPLEEQLRALYEQRNQRRVERMLQKHPITLMPDRSYFPDTRGEVLCELCRSGMEHAGTWPFGIKGESVAYDGAVLYDAVCDDCAQEFAPALFAEWPLEKRIAMARDYGVPRTM